MRKTFEELVDFDHESRMMDGIVHWNQVMKYPDANSNNFTL